MNDLRAFLPAWQDMELASPTSDDPVTQIEADVPIEPLALQAETPNLDHDMHSYERPLAVSPFGPPEAVPDWQETHASGRGIISIVRWNLRPVMFGAEKTHVPFTHTKKMWVKG